MKLQESPPCEAKLGRVSQHKKERELHECSGHATYRPWCRSCVAGRGRSQPHFSITPDVHATPIVAVDYGYLEARGDSSDAPRPILISRISFHMVLERLCVAV
eukprot:12379835-Karenia_brevis.AAC.1